MQKIEAKQVAQEVANIMDAKRDISEAEHREHHNFTRVLIKKLERRILSWEQIRKQVTGWGIIVVLSGIGLAVADYFEWLFHGKG